MKLAALFSGGKDSLYAAYLASKSHEISIIVTYALRSARHLLRMHGRMKEASSRRSSFTALSSRSGSS
jgi:diphthamide synthase (EF-2-diphthine--ammonia ligase)